MLHSGIPGTVPSHAPHTINQVIIFSYFKSVLDIIEAMMTTDGVMTCRFDGDLKDDRARELEDFKKDPKKMVLLCTIGSGGVGLNIVEANHVFFVDPWFNPQTHAQAECRVHRIGQTKPVTVTYLIMDKTIDAWMFGSESCLLSSHSEPRWPRCIRVW